jgi:HIRAN domain
MGRIDEIRLSFPDEVVRVVGVSHYQAALREIAPPGAGRVRHPVLARLVPEPTNPHDENAIQVLVFDQLVGYLSRDDAVRYGPAVRLLRDHGRVLVCEAVVAGRGPDAGTANLGVFLELPRAPEALLEAQTLVGR